jgi:hypothetical protein
MSIPEGGATQGSAARQGPTDPAGVVLAYTDAANAGDLEAALAFWAADATCTLEPAAFSGQSRFSGTTEIRSLVERIIVEHARAELGDIRVDADRVTARARFTLHSMRRLGIEALEATVDASVQDGKIQSIAYTFTPKSAGMLETARAALSASAQLPQVLDPIDGALADGPDDVPHQSSG